ncbi:MAG TPA: aminoglycoside phosphotransferase family protein [Pyrinomonadaceae bacterium]|nr:aminoglycoside phosphotransferase family protein [Pyrinomonadaceae bacterium]
MTDVAVYEERIRQLVADISIRSIRLNDEGLMNDVVIVNEELVFRFPKDEYAAKHLSDEINLLRLLQPHLTLQIPAPLYETRNILAYRLIPGETLRRDLLRRLGEDDQQAVANQLAQFLKELHGVETTGREIAQADALMKYEGWVNVYQRIREKVYPLLLAHLRDWATEHFETHLGDKRNFEYELKVVDTDLPPYHIMFDRERKRINGIIDFGCAGLGDPAIDFGVIIYNYGESFLKRFYDVYPEAEQYLPRARFYAGAHELRWLLTGVERNQPWWFAVHVGSAKDMN